MDYRVDRAETPVGKVLLDSCILISRHIRDWILILSYKSNEMDIPLFTPCVSSRIMDEFGYHMARDEEVTDDVALETIKTRILSNSERIAGFKVQPIDDFPDKNDLHLHAAAEFGDIDFLVTNDKKLITYASTEVAKDIQTYDTCNANDFLILLTEYAPFNLLAEAYLYQEAYFYEESKFYKKSKSLNLIDMLMEDAEDFARYLRTVVINSPQFDDYERDFKARSSNN